ncbi:aquaporin-11-like [Oppia nitens]|uniref:aquaporin-11-like n=1 Tax=Oppia nitens TaxID=1686743 RepID=UPI0023DB9803|nr:aquaporin-11-like [Oppia nitens]
MFYSSLIPHFVYPYLVLLLNCLLFKSLRVITHTITPKSIGYLITEFISTLELCSDCAELGVVWELHGNIGFGITLFLLCLWYAQVFGEAEACPNGPIEDCLLLGQSFTSNVFLQKFLGQLLGAIVTDKYIKCIWCWHLIPEHLHLHVDHCEASLQVTVVYGMAIEAALTFISRLVALESGNWSEQVSKYVNSFTSTALVLYALTTTGGFFNPILASALTLNCKGNTLFEHLSVYWIGSLIGSLMARSVYMFILRRETKDKSD